MTELRFNRVDSSIRQYLIVVMHFAIASCVWGQLLPDEVAMAKAKFLKKAEAAMGSKPVDLNEKYVAGLQALQAKKQSAGDLESELAIKKEIETVEATGASGTGKVSKSSGLEELRKIYGDSRLRWNNSQVDALEALKAAYLASLKKITSDFTEAGKVEEARVTRAEATKVAAITIFDFQKKPNSPAPVIADANPSGKRAGQVRGFGRLATSKFIPD